MKIELLYFEGCPSYAELLPRLSELIANEGIHDQVQLRRVETPEEAERERFLGSPTVRIDGVDVDLTAQDRDDFGMNAGSTGRKRAWPACLPIRGSRQLSVVDRGPAGLRTFCERSERILGKDGW